MTNIPFGLAWAIASKNSLRLGWSIQTSSTTRLSSVRTSRNDLGTGAVGVRSSMHQRWDPVSRRLTVWSHRTSQGTPDSPDANPIPRRGLRWGRRSPIDVSGGVSAHGSGDGRSSHSHGTTKHPSSNPLLESNLYPPPNTSAGLTLKFARRADEVHCLAPVFDMHFYPVVTRRQRQRRNIDHDPFPVTPILCGFERHGERVQPNQYGYLARADRDHHPGISDVVQSCHADFNPQPLPHPDIVGWTTPTRSKFESLEERLVFPVGSISGGKIEYTRCVSGLTPREFTEIFSHCLLRWTVENKPSIGNKQSSWTKMFHRGQLVTYVQDCSSFASGDRLHSLEALRLKRVIANRQNLIDDQDIWLKVCRHCKGESHPHTGAIAFYRCVYKSVYFCEGEDLLQPSLDAPVLTCRGSRR